MPGEKKMDVNIKKTKDELVLGIPWVLFFLIGLIIGINLPIVSAEDNITIINNTYNNTYIINQTLNYTYVINQTINQTFYLNQTNVTCVNCTNYYNYSYYYNGTNMSFVLETNFLNWKNNELPSIYAKKTDINNSAIDLTNITSDINTLNDLINQNTLTTFWKTMIIIGVVGVIILLMFVIILFTRG